MNDDKEQKDPLDALKLPKGTEGLRDQLKAGREQIRNLDKDIAKAKQQESPRPGLDPPGMKTPYTGPSSTFLHQQQSELKGQYAEKAAQHMDGMNSTERLETTRALQSELGIDPAQTRAAHHEYQSQKLDQVQNKFSDMREQSRQQPGNAKSHPEMERYQENKRDITGPGEGSDGRGANGDESPSSPGIDRDDR